MSCTECHEALSGIIVIMIDNKAAQAALIRARLLNLSREQTKTVDGFCAAGCCRKQCQKDAARKYSPTLNASHYRLKCVGA